MLKVFHDATLDFKCFTDDEWFLEYGGSLEKEMICHNDIAPYNMTFSLNKPVGIIGFDTACPASRIWDIAYAVYRFVLLTKTVYDYEIKEYRDYDKRIDCGIRRFLINKFLEGYGNYKVDEVEFIKKIWRIGCKHYKYFAKCSEKLYNLIYTIKGMGNI